MNLVGMAWKIWRSGVLMLAMPLAVLPQEPSRSAVAPGCGPANQQFEVKTDKKPHPVTQLDAGKALVYFLQDDRPYYPPPRPTVRWGVDGAWVGATHSESYLPVSVNAGERHLCAAWQSSATPQMAALHFTAEAGKTYYFRAQNYWRAPGSQEIRFEPLDSDEALLMISGYSYSTSRIMK